MGIRAAAKAQKPNADSIQKNISCDFRQGDRSNIKEVIFMYLHESLFLCSVSKKNFFFFY